jgi:hypothetical protein
MEVQEGEPIDETEQANWIVEENDCWAITSRR